MDERALRERLDLQHGVISRRQVLELGGTDSDIKRLVRRREWARVYEGVYVNHTGPLAWGSRAWAAVLFYWPAALSHESAVYLAGEVIHVAVGRHCSVVRLPGVEAHRVTGLHGRVQWNLGPPRIRFEEALLQLCERASTRVDALALVSDACQRRRTTPARIAAALRARARMRHRSWLLEVLADAESGVRSVLEAAYLRKVERAHGLPRGRRQRHERTEQGTVYRDVEYDGLALLVELDGRLGHEWADARDVDRDRDLIAAGDDRMTIRLGWRHVDDGACLTAERLARVFTARGWRGTPRACGPGCCLRGGSQPHTG